MLRAFFSMFLAAAALTPGCSSSFSPAPCKVDSDCGDGLACQLAGGSGTCVKAADAPIRIGMSAPISGPSQQLGAEMKKGVTLAFDAQNAAGGVRGRKLVLEFRDDEYQPANAEEMTRELIDVKDDPAVPARCPSTTTAAVAGQDPVAKNALDRGPNAVLALLGNVGTPTMVRSAPIAVETGTLFFGAFTGASRILRDGFAGPCSKYIFNVRASYAQEARATTEYFFKQGVPDDRHIVSFDQADAFGQAGYDGLVAAYTALKGPIAAPFSPDNPIARFRYQRDDETSVPAQVTAVTAYLKQILSGDDASHTVGIFMTDTYGSATKFIKGVRDWQGAMDDEQTSLKKDARLKLVFSNVSFVGPNALADRLVQAGSFTSPSGTRPYTENVLVTQVVPNYQSDTSDGVRDYVAAIDKAGTTPSFTSLEGYLAARVFLAGLLAHQGPLTPEALAATFEAKLPDLALGLGAGAKFSADNHNYSRSVWGTAIAPTGDFVNRYYWTEGGSIQPFE